MRALSTNMLAAAGQVLAQTLALFFLYRYLIETIGVEQIGVWSVVLATASAARISELGLASSVTKFVATYRGAGQDEYAREALQTAALSLAAFLGLILTVLYPVFRHFLPEFLPGESVQIGTRVLPYALLSLWFGAVGGVWMAALDGYLRSDLRAALMIACTLLHLVISILAASRYGLEGLAAAQVIQSVLLTVVGWVLIRRVAGIDGALPVRWRRARFRDMFSYGVNFQINSIVMLLFEPITKVLLGRYGELAAAGFFELAQRMVARVRALIVETNRVIVPVLAGMQSRESGARDLYSRNLRYLFLLLTPLFAGLVAMLPVISRVWIGSYQEMFVVISVCLAVAWYVNSITAPAYFAYLGNGRLRWITISHVVMGCANLILGLVLGGAFGWRGIIAAFAISLVVGSLIPMATYHIESRLDARRVFVRHDLLLLAACGVTAAATLAAYMAMDARGDHRMLHVSLLLGAAAVAIACITLRHPLSRELMRTARAKFR